MKSSIYKGRNSRPAWCSLANLDLPRRFNSSFHTAYTDSINHPFCTASQMEFHTCKYVTIVFWDIFVLKYVSINTAFNFRTGLYTSHNSLRFKNIIVSSVDQQISSLMSSGPPIALCVRDIDCIIPQQFSSLCYMQIKIHRYGICCGPIYICSWMQHWSFQV